MANEQQAPNPGENKVLIEAIERLGEVDMIGVDPASEREIVALPTGKKLHSLKPFIDEWRERPERRAGTARLTTLESFVAHVNRHRDEHSVIFADVDNRDDPKLISVLDYNEAGAKGAPRFGRHRAIYHYPVADEWKAWTENDDPLSQQAFAEFLEEHVADVLDPAAAGDMVRKFAAELGITLAAPQRLLELSRGLSVAVGQRVTQQVNLSTGEAQISFEERHEAPGGTAVKIPGGFALAIPVFRGGALYQVPARLRYRVQQGAIVWWFALARVDRIWDDAVQEAAAQAQTGTELPLFFGTPET